MKNIISKVKRSKTMSELKTKLDMNYPEWKTNISKKDLLNEVEYTIFDLNTQLEYEVPDCDPYYPQLKKELNTAKKLLREIKSL